MVRIAAVALAAILLAVSSSAGAQSLDGLFTREQADRGAQIFAAQCVACHDAKQAAGFMLSEGAGMSLDAYHARLAQLMPPQSPVRPTAQGYVDLIAYLSRTLGAPSGAAEAKVEGGAWKQARLPSPVNEPAKAAPAKPADLAWTNWRNDVGGSGYSAADLITPANVARLKIAWRWRGANQGPTPEARNITTPLMVGGVLYATTGLTRNVVALDPATGETLWMWRPDETKARLDNAPRKGSGRGVSYWTDGKTARIFTVTPGFHLAALDARTGRPAAKFGKNGQVDLMAGLRGAPKEGLPDIGNSSPPLVIGDVVVVGPAHRPGVRPRSSTNVKGDVRGYDARSGKLLWTFHTIPEKGEAGYDTWAPGTAERSGNAGVWAPMSADPRTGAIFLPVEAATSDVYGGARPGANAHSSSLVSLDARTGKIRWERQLVHHDVFDWDVPAMPILADIPQPGGGVRHAVLQLSKQAFVYAFDRDTGEPLWPIVERPVPTSDTPGEATYPTQPMPVKPAPFDRQGATPDDLIDYTPALRAEALQIVKPYRMGGFMAPASLDPAPDGTKGTLSLPSIYGGANWPGGAYDPTTGYLYIGSITDMQMLSLAAAPAGSDAGYVVKSQRAPTVSGLPLVKPPYGRITAIDMKTGEAAWMIANADTPKIITDNPALKGVALPRTGVVSHAGLLATKTLLFAGEGDDGSPVFRAHDKATGKILTEVKLPGTQTGLPMTYVWGGKQYIVMATAGANGEPAEIVALTLAN